jgi:hypothetical protein
MCRTEGLQQRFELQEGLIFRALKDIGQHGSRVVINGLRAPSRIGAVSGTFWPVSRSPAKKHTGW